MNEKNKIVRHAYGIPSNGWRLFNFNVENGLIHKNRLHHRLLLKVETMWHCVRAPIRSQELACVCIEWTLNIRSAAVFMFVFVIFDPFSALKQ